MSSSPKRPFAGFSLPVFALVSLLFLSAYASGAVTPGLVGVLPFLMILGALLNLAGERTPFVRSFLGGGPIVVIFGAAALATYLPFERGFFPDTVTFMKQGSFLDFYIAALITGSLLGMNRRFLLSAALRYLPVIAGAVIVALLLVGVTGWVLGFGFIRAILMVGIPIMGGGMGAGAIPLSQIMARALEADPTEVLSQMVPAVALANALAIVMGSILDRLGKRFPSITGNGELLVSAKNLDAPEETNAPVDLEHLGTGLLIASAFFAFGKLAALHIPLHPYALMILAVALAKAAGVVSPHYEACAASWYQFVWKNLTFALLFGIGVAYTDISTVIEALNPTYLAMVAVTLIGAVIGAALVARFVGFHLVEASITAGLCMANMGGTGDVAVLSASKRMSLMPFAQISSRLGGAVIIILASLLSGL
jgi:Na+/citrate or Na+/malate symporter